MKQTDRHVQRFEQALELLSKGGITTPEALLRPENQQLYRELWFSCENFVNYHALCSKNRTDTNGKRLDGNAPRVRQLMELGVRLEDVRGDCLVRIMDKLPLVLAQPLEKQKNYCFTIVNNCVIDQWRKACPGGAPMLSLNCPLGGEADAPEFGGTLPEGSTPEENYIARETLTAALRRRRADLEREREQAHRRQAEKAPQILAECAALAHRPEQLLCRLASEHLGRKNAALAAVLLRQGGTKTLAMALKRVGEKYSILCEQISAYCLPVEDGRLKLDSGSQKTVSAQVSRLVYRAQETLNKGCVLHK